MVKEELKSLKSKEKISKEDSAIDVSTSPMHFSQTPKVHGVHSKTLKSCGRKRKQSRNDIHKVQSSALGQAEELQASLDPKFPSFVKFMLHSHVSGGFWLGLPVEFCKAYLPKGDEKMTLITESGEEYTARFLAEKTGLSGGWKAFSLLNKLVVGDVLVFHLIKTTIFKVYIIRQIEIAEVDCAIGLLHLDNRMPQTYPGKISKPLAHKKKRKHVSSSAVRVLQDISTSPPVSGLELEQIGNDIDEVDSEVKDSTPLSIPDFKDVKDLESFTVMVNGFVIDSKIPKYVKAKYYSLCCSQNGFLHDHLPKFINCKLVEGMISEIVSIADAIQASKITTSQHDFEVWEKSLNAFDQLGMNIGFLRSRLQRLMQLAYGSKRDEDLKRYEEALQGQTQVEEEIRGMESKLLELKKSSENFTREIEAMKLKAERHEVKFHAEASAPW